MANQLLQLIDEYESTCTVNRIWNGSYVHPYNAFFFLSSVGNNLSRKLEHGHGKMCKTSEKINDRGS